MRQQYIVIATWTMIAIWTGALRGYRWERYTPKGDGQAMAMPLNLASVVVTSGDP